MDSAWLVTREPLASVRVEAPVGVSGWTERPWVRLRALTEAEALERESLGLAEEYELVTGGLAEPGIRVRRTYDLRAMAEYDFERCVVEFCLPEMLAHGGVVERRMGPETCPEARVEFLGHMQPALAAWLQNEIERINMRSPEQRATLEQAKKN